MHKLKYVLATLKSGANNLPSDETMIKIETKVHDSGN